MATSFSVLHAWDLGETIHVIGTVHDGVIKGGEVLRDVDRDLEICIRSVAIGGGANLPPDAITLVVDSLPCPPAELTGKKFSVIGVQHAATNDVTEAND